jgi:hypothetical protein
VGPRVGLDALVKGKYSSPCRESNPGLPARSIVTVLTELPRLLTRYKITAMWIILLVHVERFSFSLKLNVV